MIGRGVAYRKQRKQTSYGRNRGPVDREGCGVPQNGGNRLVLERYGQNGVLFIGRGVAYRKTGLHGILFISTVDPLPPPRATFHPPSISSRLHLRMFIHGLLFNHLSTGYCSSSPPLSPVHPALHGGVLFIQPSTGSCSSSPKRLDRSGSCSSRGNTTGSCSSTPLGNCSSKPPQQRSLFIQRQHRSASVSSSSEGIAQSGSVNSHRSISRVL